MQSLALLQMYVQHQKREKTEVKQITTDEVFFIPIGQRLTVGLKRTNHSIVLEVGDGSGFQPFLDIGILADVFDHFFDGCWHLKVRIEITDNANDIENG